MTLLGLIYLLLFVALAVAWLVHPSPLFGRAPGFPPGWTCVNYGRGGAQVCDNAPRQVPNPPTSRGSGLRHPAR